MIVVYRWFLGERIYDQLDNTRPAPGRPSPGAGPRIQGQLVRGAETVTTATGSDSWCAVVTKEGTLTSDMPDFSPEEEERHEGLWHMYEGLREDTAKARAGEYVPPARILMLLKHLSNVDVPVCAGIWEAWACRPGACGASTKEDFEFAYLGETKPSDLCEVASQLHHASKVVEGLLNRADSLVSNLSPPAPAPVDVQGAMARFKKATS